MTDTHKELISIENPSTPNDKILLIIQTISRINYITENCLTTITCNRATLVNVLFSYRQSWTNYGVYPDVRFYMAPFGFVKFDIDDTLQDDHIALECSVIPDTPVVK